VYSWSLVKGVVRDVSREDGHDKPGCRSGDCWSYGAASHQLESYVCVLLWSMSHGEFSRYLKSGGLVIEAARGGSSSPRQGSSSLLEIASGYEPGERSE
jgi:hypothetical protein